MLEAPVFRALLVISHLLKHNQFHPENTTINKTNVNLNENTLLPSALR